LLGFTIGCVLAGLAGVLVAPVYAINTHMGMLVIFLALVVMMLGGIGSYKGALLGGIILGLTLSFGFQFIGGLCYLAIWGLFMVVLSFRPGGLLGEALD